MNTTAEPLTDLWRRTQAKFARAVAAIGDPARIAALSLISPALRRDIIRWLRPLESIVRKLLLAEAANLAAAPQERKRGPALTHVLLAPQRVTTTSELARACAAETARALAPLDRTRPETWRARFSFALPRDPRAVPESRAPRIRALWGPPPPPAPPPRAPRSAPMRELPLRLALRFEALRRVLQDPAPHALRLARLLQRLTRRFPEIVHRYVLAPCGPDRDKGDLRLRVDTFTQLLGRELAFGDTS